MLAMGNLVLCRKLFDKVFLCEAVSDSSENARDLLLNTGLLTNPQEEHGSLRLKNSSSLFLEQVLRALLQGLADIPMPRGSK